MGFLSDSCPKCRGSVKKGAKFCSRCGAPAPSGIDKCGQCGVQVGTASKFCWSCGANLSEVARAPVVGDHWALTPDALAAKIEPGDLKGMLTKGLIVEEGTRALFFQRGKFKGELPPGKHNVGGLLQRINTFDLATPTSVILVYARDVEMELTAEGLFTQENQTIGVKCRLVMRVEEPELFSGNLLKGRSQLKIEDLKLFLSDEAKNVLQSSLSSHSVKELYGNAQLKKEIEDDLQQGLQITMERNGLTIIQLRFLDFQGAAYEAIRKEKGELFIEGEKADVAEERRKLNQRVRETFTQNEMSRFKTVKDLEDFLSQTQHELGLKDIIRDQEMEDLKRIYEQGKEDRERARQQILERMKLEFEIEQKAKRLASERGQSLESVRNELLIEKEQRLQEMELDWQEGLKGIEMLRAVKGVKYEEEKEKLALEKERLQARAAATTEALLSMIDGPQAERLVKLEQLRAKEKMTPEQILALVAEASPEAAKALAEKYKGEAQISEGRLKDLQKHLAEQKDTAEKAADRIERITERAMREMGQVAGAKASASQPQQTIVTGGGIGGQPIVIGTGAGAAQKVIKCPECGVENDPASAFCSECGAKLSKA